MIHVGSQVDKPNLMDCVRFQGREKTINIPQEIGVEYYKFGLFLLEDDSGARISSIAHQLMNNSENQHGGSPRVARAMAKASIQSHGRSSLKFYMT